MRSCSQTIIEFYRMSVTDITNKLAINKFLTSWFDALNVIAAGNPSIIQIAAKPNDFDSFGAANNGGIVSIDVALRNLVILGPRTPQKSAFLALLDADKSADSYNSNAFNVVSLAASLQARLEELLSHVEGDLAKFLVMGAHGMFSTPDIMTSDSIVKALWPAAGH
ncbi:MAG: hypothetical protein Q9220_004128 [cf. Caloplaca sp. 1 TL-2023]